MECMSFSRLFMAVTLILIYVIQKLVGRAHQASPVNLKPLHEDMDVRHLAFEDQLQFIDSDDYRTDKLLKDIQLDSVSVSYLSVSVLLFELNERQGCLGAANYSVIRTFSAVNVGQMVLQIRGFKIGSSSSASNILRGRLYNYAKQSNSKTQQQQQNEAATTTTKGYPHQNHHQRQEQPQNQLRQHQQSVCHGYGFTIHDCEPFDLEPNREHKIRIAFNPDFTLTKTIVSLTILTNLDEEFKFALVASIPRNLLATCNQSLPRPDWEPTMHLILAIGMVSMILVSILIAYMEAMLYLKSQQTTSAQPSNSQAVNTQSNHHSNGGKDCNNYSNHSNDACNKDRSNGNGHGEAAASISASISSHQQSSLPYNTLAANGKNINNYTLNTGGKKNGANNSSGNNKSNNNCTQKRRKNSSTANSEKVPTTNSKSFGGGPTNNEKNNKSSTPYVPIFQNLTNVIASPPPPLPTFDNEFASLEFKKLRGKKSAKKSNSLNGSIASSDDIGNPSSLNQSQVVGTSKGKSNGKSNGLKTSASNSINGERDVDIQTQLCHGSRESSQNRKGSLKDVFTTTNLSEVDDTRSTNVKLFNGVNVDTNQKEQPTVMPIQPPSSLSSTPSSSISSTTSSTSSSSSSTSSSPPLSASSYGEYSLLGPGATFELPCLRVRSAQI